jgi:hypothetical protein
VRPVRCRTSMALGRPSGACRSWPIIAAGSGWCAGSKSAAAPGRTRPMTASPAGRRLSG